MSEEFTQALEATRAVAGLAALLPMRAEVEKAAVNDLGRVGLRVDVTPETTIAALQALVGGLKRNTEIQKGERQPGIVFHYCHTITENFAKPLEKQSYLFGPVMTSFEELLTTNCLNLSARELKMILGAYKHVGHEGRGRVEIFLGDLSNKKIEQRRDLGEVIDEAVKTLHQLPAGLKPES